MEDFYHLALKNRWCFVAYRLPEADSSQILLQFAAVCKPVSFLSDLASQSGFLFAPFDLSGEKTLLLHADILFQNFEIKQFQTFSDGAFERVEKALQTFDSNQKPKWFYPSNFKNEILNQKEFTDLVDVAIQEIEAGEMSKVVLSRTLEQGLNSSFNPIETYEKLCQIYPNAFVSLVSIPDIGTWLGVSPELLLALEKNKLKTVALAGTIHPKKDERNYWGTKEKAEQQAVSDYIQTKLKELNLKEIQQKGPFTTQAGNLLHLKTEFEAEINANFNLGETLHNLHPTPALCGSSKNNALKFILNNEKHKRSFYGGFLGPLNLQNATQFYVNLRCMQLLKNSATLYIGAGITSDSIPKKEWQETELKAQTLLRVLG